MKFKKTLAATAIVVAAASAIDSEKLRFTASKILQLTAPWQQHYAQSKAELATVNTFPYLFNYFLLNQWSKVSLEDPLQPQDLLNNFYHFDTLATAEYRDGGSPNNDTVYSVSWFYVYDEPLIFTIPPSDRYYSFQIASFSSDNYAYMGTLSTGVNGGNFAIVPLGWQGELPEDVQLLAEAPTQWSIVLGRTLVQDIDDMANVKKLQQQYKMTALSNWGQAEYRRPSHPPVPDLAPEYAAMFADKSQGFKAVLTDLVKNNPEQYLNIVNQSMAFGGVPQNQQHDLQQYREIGFGIDAAATAQDFVQGRNLGISLGLLDVIKSKEDNYGSKTVDGWRIIDPSYGRTGDSGHYLLRASMQSLGGIIANDAVESMYFVLNDDVNEPGVQRPVGSNNYILHFSKEQLPAVDAFWSLTLYDSTNNLVANELDRYSLGDRSPSLRYDDDGGLTLYIGNQPPANKADRGNWLPAPETGFYLILRTYLPSEAIVSQRWAPPPMILAQ